MHPNLSPTVFLCLCIASSTQAAIQIESGSFFDEIETLRGLSFEANSNDYVAPSANERTSFRSMANALYQNNFNAADAIAGSLGYEVVQFTDNNTSNIFYGLRETLNGGEQTKGWGSYFIRTNYQSQALVEVPHVRFDTHTTRVASDAFQESGARGFLMAGAHRNSNGQGTADVAHLADSIFQEVHEAWISAQTNTITFQIHGFDIANHGGFPAGTDAVLSNGTGGVSSEIIQLDAALESGGFDSYAYNTLQQSDPDNIAVNGSELGTTFSGLGGTTNEQRQFSTAVGSTFLHIELERSIRFDSNNRAAAATLISDTIIATTAVPEARHFASVLTVMIGTVTWLRRKRL